MTHATRAGALSATCDGASRMSCDSTWAALTARASRMRLRRLSSAAADMRCTNGMSAAAGSRPLAARNTDTA